MQKIHIVAITIGILFSIPLQAGNLTIRITNEKQEPLSEAVVYLESDQPVSPPAEEHIEIEQKQKMFNPFVTIMPRGTTAMFPNRDGIGHHVYSFSPVKNFQLPLSEHETTDTITFDKPGVVTVGCNIHDWMVAYIYIVDTPWYAKSDAQGLAVIDNVPEGDYKIHVAHPGMKATTAQTRQISIVPGADNRLEFALEIKPEYFWRPAPQTDEEIY